MIKNFTICWKHDVKLINAFRNYEYFIRIKEKLIVNYEYVTRIKEYFILNYEYFIQNYEYFIRKLQLVYSK